MKHDQLSLGSPNMTCVQGVVFLLEILNVSCLAPSILPKSVGTVLPHWCSNATIEKEPKSAWGCSWHQDASVHGPSVADIKKCGTQSMEFVCPVTCITKGFMI